MSRLYWQLPWAGPMRGEGERAEWAVMPSPGMGDAMAVCVPVSVQGTLVALAVADRNRPIPLVAAPMGVWTTVAGEAGTGSGFLCLVGYDLPEGGLGENYVVTSGVDVAPADVEEALEKLKMQHEDLADHVLAGPAAGVAAAPASGPMRAAARAESGAVGAAAASPPPVSLTLAFASCQYPSGLMDGLPAEASLQRLADLLQSGGAQRPQLLLLLGDQIYADATAGLLDPIRLDDRYRAPYEELMHIKPLRRITGRITVYSMLDDHEIADNWEPDQQGSRSALFEKGLAAYWTYQRKLQPQPQPQPRPDTWRHLELQGWHLFMADTRTVRQLRCEATLASALILGQTQTRELEDWLLERPPGDLKLIATPAMLLPRPVEHLDAPLHLDGWTGYPASMDRLLAFLCDNQIQNVCFLSGDAHLGCDVSVTITGPAGSAVTTRSIHSPALYAPLPFANEKPWNLKLPLDTFSFPGPRGEYTCSVEGDVMRPLRDGCCLLKARRDDSGWHVSAQVV